jgi:hypothetical protein
MATEQLTQSLDITAPKLPVQVEIRADGQVLWVHVDGITVLRICRLPGIEVIDNRQEQETN